MNQNETDNDIQTHISEMMIVRSNLLLGFRLLKLFDYSQLKFAAKATKEEVVCIAGKHFIHHYL